MKHFRLSAALAACFAILPLCAQTLGDYMEKAISGYSKLKELNEGYLEQRSTSDDGPIIYNEEAYAELITTYNDAMQNLTLASNLAGVTEKNQIRYFNMLLNYELAYCYYNGSKTEDAEKYLKLIYGEFNYFSEGTAFPIVYKLGTVNYTINYKNFSPLIGEYYSLFTELSNTNQQYTQAIEVGWKYFLAPNQDSLTASYVLSLMLDAKIKPNTFDAERLKIASKLQLQLISLSKENLEGFEQLTGILQNDFIGVQDIINIYNANASLDDSAKYALITAQGLENAYPEQANKLYDLALKYEKGNFHAMINATKFYLSKEKEKSIKALNIAEKMAPKNCASKKILFEMFTQVDNKDKAKKWEDDYNECEKNRKREERRRGNYIKENYTTYYLSTNPFPWISRPDPNFNIGLIKNKWGIELGYRNVNRRREYPLDIYDNEDNLTEKYYWNGSRISAQIRSIKRDYKGAYTFLGLYTSYSIGKYEPIETYITDPNGNSMLRTYNPRMTQIHLVPQIGALYAKDGFYLEYYLGIGASRMQFNGGKETNYYGVEGYKFTDPLLKYRTPTSYKFEFRWGLTFGLAFH